ncbi:MAG: FMN-binding negative transcriptional regulator [Pseudomonadota bacterium]
MYAPSHFDETRSEVLHALIGSHPLATLVCGGAGGLDADHLPFEVAPPTPQAPFGVLRAHVARANPLWRRSGEAVLAVFQGPAAYISPAFYEEKAASGKVVPTWNYAVAHAHGTLRAVDDPAWLFALLERLTAQQEGGRDLPWSVHDAPRAYIEQLLGAIVGIEIVIGRLQGKWKLSQNRPLQDQRNIAAGQGGAMGAMLGARLASL